MIARLIALFTPPRQLPEPDPRCKQYDYGGLVQLIRNHARQFEISDARR